MPYFYYNTNGNPMVVSSAQLNSLGNTQIYYTPNGVIPPQAPPSTTTVSATSAETIAVDSETLSGSLTSGAGNWIDSVAWGNVTLAPSVPTESETSATPTPTPTPTPSPSGISAGLIYNPSSWAKKNLFKEVKNDMKFYNRSLNSIISWANRSPGEIGLEIECEGKNLDRTLFKYWQCHSDGSLRIYEGHEPVEYVLREPLPRKEVKEALEYLHTKLKEAKAKVVKSQRTSVHVHVNCQKLSVRELFCFICLYLIFEELLVEWSGPERVGNLFCLRAKDSEFFIQMLEQVLKNENFKSWRDEYRYAACNVASIVKFGSLEFRSMQGTIDPEYISLWVDILCMIKDTSLKYDSPVQIVEEFITLGPLPFFKKIFSDDHFRAQFENIPQLSSKLWDGLRMMRDVAYSCDWEEPKKTNQTEPEKVEQERVRAGDRVSRWGHNNMEVYVCSGDDTLWRVRTHPLDPSTTYRVPDGMSMYYVYDFWKSTSDFIVLEIRQGLPEYRYQLEESEPEPQESEPQDNDHSEDFFPEEDFDDDPLENHP